MVKVCQQINVKELDMWCLGFKSLVETISYIFYEWAQVCNPFYQNWSQLFHLMYQLGPLSIYIIFIKIGENYST